MGCDHDWNDCEWSQKDRGALVRIFTELGKSECAPGCLVRCSRCGQYAMQLVVRPEATQVRVEVRL